MAKAYVTDIRYQKSLPSYQLRDRQIQKTRLTIKLARRHHDLQNMKLAWKEAEEFAAHNSERHRLVAQYASLMQAELM